MPFFSPANVGTVTVTGSVSVSNFPASQVVAFDLNVLADAWASFGTGTGNMTSLPNSAGNCAMAFALNSNSSPCREAALVYLQTKMGAAAPTAGAAIEYYLVRSTGTDGESDDNVNDAGEAQQANFWSQADLLAAFNVVATANVAYRRVVDTFPLGVLGNGKWGIGARNGTSQALSGTAGDHVHKYMTYSRRGA